jgi:hypothetical protein
MDDGIRLSVSLHLPDSSVFGAPAAPDDHVNFGESDVITRQDPVAFPEPDVITTPSDVITAPPGVTAATRDAMPATPGVITAPADVITPSAQAPSTDDTVLIARRGETVIAKRAWTRSISRHLA